MRRLKRMNFRNMLKLPLIMLMMVLMMTACEQDNGLPVGSSLTVTVQDSSGSKTIGPAGNVNITDYVITLSNGEMDISSGQLEKGESYTVTNIPVGMWTAKVDAYVENEAAEGGRVLIATKTSAPVRVTEGSSNTISVVLDELVEAVSGDVVISLKFPSSFTSGSSAYVIWTIGNGTVEHSVSSWSKALALTVGEDLTADLILDADNLLGGGEMLLQGVWDIIVTARSSRYSSTNECSGKEIMRLLPGLPAEGIVDLSGMDSSDGGFDVTIGTDLGSLQEFGFTIATDLDGLSLIPVDGNEIAADEYSFFVDGTRVETSGDIWYEYIDEWNDERFLMHGLSAGNHLLLIVRDDGTPFGGASISLQVAIPEYMEVTVEYMDLMDAYEIPEGHTNYGFADPDGNYVQFPYTGPFEDMNGDGQIQIPELGLTALDVPDVVEDQTYTRIRNNTIVYSVIPGTDVLPELSGEREVYVAFAEGPTDVGNTRTNGITSGGFSGNYRFTRVHYLFPESIVRMGRDVLAATSQSSYRDYTFRSIPSDDFPEELGNSEVNVVGSADSVIFPEGSPYYIEDCFLYKDGAEGKELLAILTALTEDYIADFVTESKVFLPEGIEIIRTGALTQIDDFISDIEGGAVLVMPSTLKKVEGPLQSRGDILYLKAIIFNEGFESLGPLYDGYHTWDFNSYDNSVKIVLPSTIKEIAQQTFPGEYSTPEFYVALPEDSFDWNSLFSYEGSSQDMVIYFDGEWAEGEDGVPVADKLKLTEMSLSRRYDGYYIDFDDLYFARIDYRYEYTIDGSEPAEPTEASEKIDNDVFSASYGYAMLHDVCPLWDTDKPLRLKIRLFSEGSGPSDTVLLSYDPS